MINFSARQEPLKGWVPQIWLEEYKNWFDFPNWKEKGYWKSPTSAIHWMKNYNYGNW